jgi:hypothetical protein
MNATGILAILHVGQKLRLFPVQSTVGARFSLLILELHYYFQKLL